MLIFHGSDKIIKKPQFGQGNPYNDYGLGFYCTESLDMAKEWSVKPGQDGFVNSYTLDSSSLKILNLQDAQYSVLNWLAILLDNRLFDTTNLLAQEAKEYLLKEFLPEYKSYDLIYGYRADDSYFSFAQDFLNGTISIRQLSNAMKLGKLGMQVVLISKKAFAAIKFQESISVSAKEWYPKRMTRDKMARSDYFNKEKNARKENDLYITKILDEKMRNGDDRLR